MKEEEDGRGKERTEKGYGSGDNDPKSTGLE